MNYRFAEAAKNDLYDAAEFYESQRMAWELNSASTSVWQSDGSWMHLTVGRKSNRDFESIVWIDSHTLWFTAR